MDSTDPGDSPVADSAWTAGELRACVEAYRELLLAEQRGERPNKSTLRRRVLAGDLRGRSAGSYEFRMQNISAVLADLGSPYVAGYLPRRNIGSPKPALIALINELWGRTALLEMPTGDPDALDTRVEAARERMRSAGRAPPPGSRAVPRVQVTALRFARDPNVIAWVLQVASGRCEICSAPAPFGRINGEPYLEVHHVRTLAEGGPDTIDNAVAGCPNCHRRLHHGQDREKLRRSIVASVDRILDYPKRQVANNPPAESGDSDEVSDYEGC